MRIDGKDNVKERIEIFNTENSNYITYKYVFENDNSYNDTVPKWTQKDKSIPKGSNVDTWLENNYWKKI